MSELKPCPFCGEPVDYDEDAEHISCKDYENGCGFFFDISTYGSKEEAAAYWNRRAPSAEQQLQEPVGMVRLVTYEGVAKNSVEWEAVLSEEVKFNRDRFKDGEALYTHQQPQTQGEPVATLHSDGYWVWKGSAPPESNYAGWKMEVYAQPRAAVPDGWKLVPIEPTPEMVNATFAGLVEDQSVQGQMRRREEMKRRIALAIAAAPAQPGEGE